MIRKWLQKRRKEKEWHFNANVQGFLLTKSDRINARIEKFGRLVKKQNTTIAVKDFNSFVKSVQILIAQELTWRGNTRDVEVLNFGSAYKPYKKKSK